MTTTTTAAATAAAATAATTTATATTVQGAGWFRGPDLNGWMRHLDTLKAEKKAKLPKLLQSNCCVNG